MFSLEEMEKRITLKWLCMSGGKGGGGVNASLWEQTNKKAITHHMTNTVTLSKKEKIFTNNSYQM